MVPRSGAKTGRHPPCASLSAPLPSHGRTVLALRPACASWIPATAPCASMNRKMRASISMCSSFQIPRSCGLIRPSGTTAVASAITRRRAADRAAAEMHEMPVVREAVLARILAHRRHADAIAQTHVAQLQRREEIRGHGAAIRFPHRHAGARIVTASASCDRSARSAPRNGRRRRADARACRCAQSLHAAACGSDRAAASRPARSTVVRVKSWNFNFTKIFVIARSRAFCASSAASSSTSSGSLSSQSSSV